MPDQNRLRREFLWGAGGAIAAGVSAKAATPIVKGDGFNVRSFGAVGDGKTLDTAAINKAIDAANAAGGGTVLFPAGSYLSYSIHLRSNVDLYLDQGSTIIAADGTGYDAAEPNEWDHYQDYGHSHWHNSLLWGEGIENIGILGPGLMWGRGLSPGWSLQPGPRAEDPGVADKIISLKNCRNVTLRDFAMLHGGHFGILATGVDNFTIDNLRIDTNRDGMDIDCCRNVRITNCSVNSPWDDGICLKSSFGLGWAKPTEFVTISNCYVSGCYEEGAMLDGTWKRISPDAHSYFHGRIKFGTESNGGFRNITVSDCVFDGCQGLALESVDGARLEDIAITNISMRDIKSAPIFLRLGSRMRGPAGAAVGTLKRVLISNIACSGSVPQFGSIISGIPGHPVEDVKISHVHIAHQGGGTKQQAALEPAERENAYPEPNMFGDMPSHGFYLRHVRGIQFDNVEIETERADLRPVFALNDVQDADFFHIRAKREPDAPVFELRDVKDLAVHMCRGMADTVLASVEKSTL